MSRFNLIVVKHLESIQYLKEHNFYTCGEYKDGFQVYTRDYFGSRLLGEYANEMKVMREKYGENMKECYLHARKNRLEGYQNQLLAARAPGFYERQKQYEKERYEIRLRLLEYTWNIELWYNNELDKLWRHKTPPEMREALLQERIRREDALSAEPEYLEILQRSRDFDKETKDWVLGPTAKAIHCLIKNMQRERQEYRQYCKIAYELSRWEPFFYFGTIYGDVIELHEVGAVPLRNLNEGHLAFLEYDDILRIDCR